MNNIQSTATCTQMFLTQLATKSTTNWDFGPDGASDAQDVTDSASKERVVDGRAGSNCAPQLWLTLLT
jgi:hypothetical protein